MREILVLTAFWPTKQNSISGIFVVQQVKALCDLGCRVTVIVGQPIGKANVPLSLSELGLTQTSVRLRITPLLRLPEIWSGNAIALRLNIFFAGVLTRRSIVSLLPCSEGIIIHGIRYFGLSLTRWKRTHRAGTLLFVHGVDPFLQRTGMATRITAILRSLRGAVTRYVVVGSPLLDHATALGIDRHDLVVIPNGTEIPDLPSTNGRPAPSIMVNILSVSNLIRLKGIDDNLHALALLQRTYGIHNWNYRIVGDGPEMAALRKLCSDLGLDEKVRFLGRLSYADTMKEMNSTHIFSLPSWAEAFGIVYLEAMARYKAVVGCLGNGAADIITHGEDGLLVPPKNPHSLALALKALIEDSSKREEVGLKARRTAERYTWKANAQRTLDLLVHAVSDADRYLRETPARCSDISESAVEID